MPVSINGSGTVTGISVGGFPDGIVDADMLAANAVASAKIASGAITAAKLASGVGGKIIQFKYAAANAGTFSTTSQGGSGEDVGGMSVSLTLTSSSNKVLVVLSLNPYIGGSGAGRAALKLFRDTTMIYEETYANFRESDGTCKATRSSHIYLDNPADTNSHTYKVALKRESGSNTIYLQDEGANAHTISLYEVDPS